VKSSNEMHILDQSVASPTIRSNPEKNEQENEDEDEATRARGHLAKTKNNP